MGTTQKGMGDGLKKSPQGFSPVSTFVFYNFHVISSLNKPSIRLKYIQGAQKKRDP